MSIHIRPSAPTLFINTKIKSLNPHWEQVGLVPLESALRDQIGVSLNKDEIKTRAADTVRDMLQSPQRWSDQIEQVLEHNVFNLGHC